jgi:glutamate dehydrogenase/leucine dehydrogenase
MPVETIADGPVTLGYIAIDSTVGGRASGGLRLLPDVNPTELEILARAMTLKYGLVGSPQGGAKAGC